MVPSSANCAKREPTPSASTSTSSLAHRKDPEGRYLKGGAEKLPLRDQSVDVATMMRSLHHVPDPRSAFPELARVVRELCTSPSRCPRVSSSSCCGPSTTRPRCARRRRRRSRRSGFELLKTIEYDVLVPLRRLEELRDRVLAADPTREDRWAAVEHQLAGRFKPGEFPIPMRVDILKPQR